MENGSVLLRPNTYMPYCLSFPEKKCTDLQMDKEQFDFAFFLSCQLPMREGRLEDIGTTCLLFTIEKLPS